MSTPSTAKKATSPAAKKATRPATKKRGRAGSPLDAIKLLTQDHREVKALFQEYQSLVDHEAQDDEKQPVAAQICALLTVHATIEEEIFYPAAQEAIKEPDLVDEAQVEHASAKELIAQIEGSSPADELYDAKVKVLGEYIDHHVKEEEGDLFPQARRARIDLEALGAELAERKAEMMTELGLADEEAEEIAE